MDTSPTVSTLRRALESLQAQVTAAAAPCTILRTPYITGSGDNGAVAQFYTETLVSALMKSVELMGLVIVTPQFGSPLFYEDETLWDAFDYEVCPADELVERFIRRRLWHVDCPFPIDLGLCDEQPTLQQLAEHSQQIAAYFKSKKHTPLAVNLPPGEKGA